MRVRDGRDFLCTWFVEVSLALVLILEPRGVRICLNPFADHFGASRCTLGCRNREDRIQIMVRGQERVVGMTMRRGNGITISRIGHASEAQDKQEVMSILGPCSMFSSAYSQCLQTKYYSQRRKQVEKARYRQSTSNSHVPGSF
jgi:hypothetical protein